jgi:3-methyladenine DNA glycosylase AlkD
MVSRAAPTPLLARLEALADPAQAVFSQRFFKTGPGQYGAGDQFLGIRVPAVRRLVREFRATPLADAVTLLASPWHEARLLGLLLMVERYGRGDAAERQSVYDAYLGHTARINNWDLVDVSAPNIVGRHLLDRDRGLLDRLAASASLWERRIALLATHAFIRNGEFADTLALCERLLDDRADLIHKAAGWMLREVGKRDGAVLAGFLDRHAAGMPRTMLRYAIERLPPVRRHHYLTLKPTP